LAIPTRSQAIPQVACGSTKHVGQHISQTTAIPKSPQ
jgi:hypothetical protein